MEKIRIGIVGMGFIADWHYQGFLKNPDAKIVGMTQDYYGDKNKISFMIQQLKEKCDKWKINTYDSFEEIVSDKNVDALIIGSINPYHFDQIKMGIKNNKHLLVEKPVLTDLGELEEIQKLIVGNNVKIFPAHNFAYRNAVLKTRELLKEGRIGKIIRGSFVSAHTISKAHETGWRSKKELSSGGALMDSGHHLVYQSLLLMGMPVRLQAFSSKLILKKMECEDTAQINLIYPDGSLAVIMQTWGSTHGHFSNGIKIIGEKGELAVTDALYLNGEKIDSDVDYGNSFVNQAKAFTDYILFEQEPVSTIKDAEDTLRIILSAYESIENNSVISF